MSESTERLPAIPDPNCFLELEDLHKSFGGTPVLSGVNMRVPKGKVTTILGGSGSGKSVMLKHMIGLLRPDSGRVIVEGRDVTKLREREWIEVRKRFGYVFQAAALFDSLTVFENIAYPLREHFDQTKAELAHRVEGCLESVGLAGVGAKMPAELSGGMRKRVGVARAIAMRPQAILYDEPTTGLDPANSRRIGQLIRQLQKELSVTSVVVTHEPELCLAVSDHVVVLERGQLSIDAPVDEFRVSNAPAVREFLGALYAPTAEAAASSDPAEPGEARDPTDRREERHGG
ncbi:MAG: ABC transporter ATP-binding protein [Myxococcota bacterium]|jgi:phospholipid/cholesterol/gamma-HCH transport system ATP-binding protein|nr:ABC transporter ATP-binding protein [Myxococcota bacterium]